MKTEMLETQRKFRMYVDNNRAYAVRLTGDEVNIIVDIHYTHYPNGGPAIVRNGVETLRELGEVIAEAIRLAETQPEKLARVAEEKKIMAHLDGLSVTVQAKANENQRLFDSVGPEQIVAAIESESGFFVKPKHIILEKEFWTLGVWDVLVRFASGIEGKIKLWIVKED